MLEKICTKERNGDRSYLEIPGITPGTGTTGESERNQTGESERNQTRSTANTGDPSAVNKWTLSSEDDLGRGNTEAPEFTRNSRPERIRDVPDIWPFLESGIRPDIWQG